jgi:ADP-ribose pyrophosphatase
MSERTVFTGKYVVAVTLEERNGRTYERVRIRDGVSVILITDEGKIRCIEEIDWNTGSKKWKLVSGYCEDGEAPITCAQRELKEEIGLTANNWQFYYEATSEEPTVRKTQSYFVARGLRQGQAHPDTDEQIKGTRDFSLEEIRGMVFGGKFGSGSTAFVLWKFVDEYLI